jgi:dTDP-4-dehydrorhamnose reductase
LLPERIARVAYRHGIRFVHISTEGVYDGVNPGKRKESEQTRPVTAYGRSKLEGEGRVLASCPEALIARVSVFGWTIPGETPKLAEKILAKLTRRRELKLPTEVVFSPLHAGDLADTLLDLVAIPEAIGVMNVGARDGISLPNFARLIADTFGLNSGLVRDATLEECEGFSVPWPKNVALDVSQAERLIGRKRLSSRMPTVEDGVNRLYRESWDGTAVRIRGREEYP